MTDFSGNKKCVPKVGGSAPEEKIPFYDKVVVHKGAGPANVFDLSNFERVPSDVTAPNHGPCFAPTRLGRSSQYTQTRKFLTKRPAGSYFLILSNELIL